MKRNLINVATILFLIAGASAQSTWKTDKAHSRVNFSVSHMLISEVTGRFTDFEVTLVAAKDDFSDAKIAVTIKSASINTDNDTRDKHLKSDDFLNAERFPTITFKSTNIERTGDNTYGITGNLTIRDSTKPVVLDTKLTGQTKAPWGAMAAGFKATTTIDRFDYGVKWNKTLDTGGLIAGNKVEITLLLEFDQQQNPAAK